ncbi:MAG: hypothetical protein V3R81_03225 [Gammaproteobacteria bacterium]
MHSPVTALLGERWRRTRWALIVAILAPGCGWLIRVAGYDTVGGIIATSFGFLGLELLAGVLLFAQCEMRNLNLGFPRRLFRFPVGTVTLICVYMGYGVVAMALPVLVAFGVAKAFGDSLEDPWTVFLIVVTGFVWLQTLAWIRGARSVFFFLIPSIVGMFMLLYVAARFLLPLDAYILCPVILVLCCGVSFWSVSADRRGAWISGWRWLGSLAGVFRRRRTKGFASGLHAQRWFEWRQTGDLFPVAALAFVGPLLAGKIVMLILSNESPSPALAPYESIPETVSLLLLGTWVGGALCFAVHHRDHQSGASGFWLRRPIPTWALAFARFQSGALSIVSTLAIFAMITLVMLVRDWIVGVQSGVAGFIPYVLEDRSLFEVGVVAVLALFGFVLVCWTLLTLPGEVFFITIGLEAAFGIVWLSFGGDVVRVMDFFVSDFMRWCGCVTAVGLVIGTLWLFHLARRRKLIDSTALVYTACLFPVAAVSLWAFFVWVQPNGGWPSPMEGVYTLGAAAVPFIPLARGTLSIAKRRHL